MRGCLRPVLLACLAVLPAHAALRMAAPFGEHMVLPRGVPVQIWGTGAPGGDTVRVSIQGQTAVAHSDWNGRWLVQLQPLRAGGPFQMNVSVGGVGPQAPSSAANDTAGLEVNDVLVGEVVQDGVLPSPGDLPAPASHQPSAHPDAFVRVYRAGTAGDSGHWTLVRQDTIPTGSDSLFATGRAMYAARGVPIGVVETVIAPRCPPSTSCSAH